MASGPFRFSTAATISAVDALMAHVDAGAGPNATCEVRTGPPPATTGAADTGVLLATIDLASPAFGDATSGAGGALVALAGAPLSAPAIASGTAGHCRVKDKDGGTVFQGYCGGEGSGEHFILNRVDVSSGGQVVLNSINYSLPESF